MINQPKTQLRKKLVLLPRHLVVLKRIEHQYTKVGAHSITPETKRPFLCEKIKSMVKRMPENRTCHPNAVTLSLNSPSDQQVCTQQYPPTSPCCNVLSQCSPLRSSCFLQFDACSLNTRSPPLLTDPHRDAFFVINRRSFCSVSPCQHPSAFSSPQFISAANGQQSNLNQTEFYLSDIDFVFTQYVYRPKKKKGFYG